MLSTTNTNNTLWISKISKGEILDTINIRKWARKEQEGEEGREDRGFMPACGHTHVPQWPGHFQWKGEIKPSIKAEKLPGLMDGNFKKWTVER